MGKRLKLSYQDGVLRVPLRTWLLAAAAFCGGEALLVSLTIVLLVRLVVKLCP